MFRKAVFQVLTILFAIASPLASGQGTTPNMGLSLPARGTLNWDVQLRANFTTLDQYYGYLTPTFQGPWSMSTTYHKGQQVSYLGSLYSSIADDATNLNNIPSSSPLSWLLMVSGGGVSSVGLTVPGEFSVSGSPVTGSSSFTVTKTTQTAGAFWGGPCTGIPATSGFRALCATDIPNITESQVTGLASDLAAKAPLASPALTGAPTAPTVSTGDNSTAIATSAFVKNQNYVTASSAPVTSVAGKTGSVTLAEGDTVLSDVTTNNATTSQHGFLKKLPNNAALFLDGTGNFSTPSGGLTGSGTTGNIPYWTSSTGLGDSPLVRSTANIMEQRNGATAQTHIVYGSYTNSSNNNGIRIIGSSVLTGGQLIQGFANGSGSQEAMQFDFISGQILGFSSNLTLLWFVDSAGGWNGQSAGSRFNKYQGRSTASGTPGLPVFYGTPINIQGQTTALSATNVFGSAPVGLYEINGYLVITTAGTSGTIAVNVLYTDETGSQTMVLNTLGNIGLLDSKLSFSGVVRSDGGAHDIQVSTTFGTVIGTPTYSIYAVCTQLMNQ